MCTYSVLFVVNIWHDQASNSVDARDKRNLSIHFCSDRTTICLDKYQCVCVLCRQIFLFIDEAEDRFLFIEKITTG
jgi:hypothetical protein